MPIYKYSELKDILRVGDEVRAVYGKRNDCNKLDKEGKKSAKITNIDDNGFKIDGCWHSFLSEAFLELFPRTPSWETLKVGDVIVSASGLEATVLEVGASRKTFLRSMWGIPDVANGWLTLKEEGNWTLKSPIPEPPICEMTLAEVEQALGKKIKIVE